MKKKNDIPLFFPTDYHMGPFQEGIGFDPFVSYIGVMKDEMEKAAQDAEDL